MKIRINEDLLEKIVLAKRGITLKSSGKETLFLFCFTAVSCFPMYYLLGVAPTNIQELMIKLLKITNSTLFWEGVNIATTNKAKKMIALEELRQLADKLGDIYINTTVDKLLQSTHYKTEYSLNMDSFPPTIKQDKYFMVPVNNEWGNNERSLKQEHTIGTRAYDLSYGEPEQEKVYSLKRQRVLNK